METITYVIGFVTEMTVRFAPVFLLAITLAVLIRHLSVADVARRWLQRRDAGAIAAGTALGAFSPFCSCTVVPVVRGLLVAGVPLAGVMAFWVAAPLMDPEIFLVTVGLLGWELAVVRLLAALVLSVAAGGAAALALRRGWIRGSLLREDPVAGCASSCGSDTVDQGGNAEQAEAPVLVGVGATTTTAGSGTQADVTGGDVPVAHGAPSEGGASGGATVSTWRQLTSELRGLDRRAVAREVGRESWLVGRWLLVAFVLEALILLHVPQEALVAVLGEDAPWAVPLAALLGVPLYLDNLSALPVVSGLLAQGMSPGAAIAFLLAGPVTTIPAMAAVRGIVTGQVFRLYLAVGLGGSMVIGTAVDLLL